LIVCYLPPFPFRGGKAPYLWVFYKLLCTVGAEEPLFVLTGSEYLEPPTHWADLNRWELKPEVAKVLGFHVPTKTEIDRHTYRLFSNDLYNMILGQSQANPLIAFARFLSEPIPVLVDEISTLIEPLAHSGSIDFILSWVNCPSLNQVACNIGAPVVHMELGPLRPPLYRATGYFDFSGVNGNTEAEARYLSIENNSFGDCQLEEMREFFLVGFVPDAPEPDMELGLAFQVEDDSNQLAFSCGYSNQGLLAYGLAATDREGLWVRGHPGSAFAPRAERIAVDNGPNSVDFILRSRRIATVNSSLALEAILFGRPVDILGEASFAHLTRWETNSSQQRAALFHYLFAYLVPFDLMFTS
jgi:hypothetical protein